MTEQQYRTIADTTTHPDLTSAHAEPGDRLVHDVIDGDRWTLVRIERPVPTTDEPKRVAEASCFRSEPHGPHYWGQYHGDKYTKHCLGLGSERAQPAPQPPTREQIAEEDRIRRDERMRWAIYLWGMDEDTDGPEGAFEEGADMAYHAVGAWLLANIAGSFAVSDMPWLDPDLIADAKSKARLLPAHPDSEVHEVDRCVAVLALIQNGADR